jgi:hypothetical protein
MMSAVDAVTSRMTPEDRASDKEKIMAFVVAHRLSGLKGGRGSAMLRVVRRLADKLRGPVYLTPQERANLYVSRMPIAVVTASLGGHPAGGAGNQR